MKTEIQTFNDGIVSIYKTVGGDKMKFKRKLRYDERTVGIKRYYLAKQENSEITCLLRVPKLRDISTLDIAVIGGVQHHIRRIACPKDVVPPCWDISLERVVVSHEIV